ncbi:MAG: hypothetical protein KDE51_20240, partial [Anaerolineales bacterium]|nr:hypothetical protein [Anaerolineales bacterium]
APLGAAELLSKSRLDWQCSLSRCLKLWCQEAPELEQSGHLILAWTNLGSLVEGTLKLFLSVRYETYKNDVDAMRNKTGKLREPDGLTLEPIRQFFKKNIWDTAWDDWVQHIQYRRNAIHAFKNREIGTHGELVDDIRTYLQLIRYINYRLPYPDKEYIPQEK